MYYFILRHQQYVMTCGIYSRFDKIMYLVSLVFLRGWITYFIFRSPMPHVAKSNTRIRIIRKWMMVAVHYARRQFVKFSSCADLKSLRQGETATIAEVSIHSSTSRVQRTFKPIKRFKVFIPPRCILYILCLMEIEKLLETRRLYRSVTFLNVIIN